MASGINLESCRSEAKFCWDLKRYMNELSVHPNHLNALLKKHTGQNVSTHIKSKLLGQTKGLLLQTDWSLHAIAYSIGFTEQPNFKFVFQKEYRDSAGGISEGKVA